MDDSPASNAGSPVPKTIHYTMPIGSLATLATRLLTSTAYLPRIEQFRSIDQAAGMADRFDRMFMRALRQLRDLRRYTVVVQKAGQVNVVDQQVNVT